MALLRGPYGTSQIKGSIGPVSFQQSPYGTIARARTVPVNPNTMRQQEVRNAMNLAAQLWKVVAADPVLYAAWVNYAENTTWHNRLGDTVKLGARQHFLRINTFLLAGGGGSTSTPPAVTGVPSPPIIEYSVDTTDGFQLLAGFPTLAAGDLAQFQLSGPQNQSRYYWTGPYMQTIYIDSGYTYPTTVIPDTGIIIGQRYFFAGRVFLVDQGLSVKLSGWIDVVA